MAQAIILICFYSYSSARFVEVWLYCGLATRICAPLGLNHIESIIQDTPLASDPVVDTNKAPNNGQGVKIDDTRHRKREKQAGFAPQSEEDKAEQASVFWKAFVADRLATACTGWASSLAEDEISTLLPKPNPKPGPIQPVTAEEMEHLSISSPTFFTSNSLPLVDAPNLHYKSVILLGRVCAFLRSAYLLLSGLLDVEAKACTDPRCALSTRFGRREKQKGSDQWEIHFPGRCCGIA